MSRFIVSAHRLEVETGRWHKPVAVHFNEIKCRTCLNCLEDEFHFYLNVRGTMYETVLLEKIEYVKNY